VGAVTKAQAIVRLAAIDTSDPERAHGEADEILLALVGPDVAAAYGEVQIRTRWWATA
jgi:hypothetical protein